MHSLFEPPNGSYKVGFMMLNFWNCYNVGCRIRELTIAFSILNIHRLFCPAYYKYRGDEQA